MRQARAVVGGLALGVLMIAGAAIASIFSGRAPADWLDAGNIVVSDEATTYVVVAENEPLQPVINMTSARLIQGTDAPLVTVDKELIDEQELDPMIGIFGAPTSLPATSNLRGSGWTSCTHQKQGAMFHVGDQPSVTPVGGDSGLVVATRDDQRFLLAESKASDSGFHRYRLPGNPTRANTVLNSIGLNTEPSFVVGQEWLRLFPEGGALDMSSFTGLDGRSSVPYAADLGVKNLKAGGLVSDGQQTYVAGPDQLHPLSDFDLAVYEKVRTTTGVAEVSDISVTSSPLPSLGEWPEQIPVDYEAGDEACAVLDAAPGQPARTLLAAKPADAESAEGVESGKVEVTVQPGSGAYVLSGAQGAASGGSPVLIDMDGKRYRLGGAAGETVALLGYADYDPPTVPDPWIENFACGPELSQEAALRVPDPDALEACRPEPHEGTGDGS